MTKPIGYYAGFLSQEDQDKITEASSIQLSDLLFDVAESVYTDIDLEQGYSILKDLGWRNASTRERLSLIRGICDRIEEKLTEVAE